MPEFCSPVICASSGANESASSPLPPAAATPPETAPATSQPSPATTPCRDIPYRSPDAPETSPAPLPIRRAASSSQSRCCALPHHRRQIMLDGRLRLARKIPDMIRMRCAPCGRQDPPQLHAFFHTRDAEPPRPVGLQRPRTLRQPMPVGVCLHHAQQFRLRCRPDAAGRRDYESVCCAKSQPRWVVSSSSSAAVSPRQPPARTPIRRRNSQLLTGFPT